MKNIFNTIESTLIGSGALVLSLVSPSVVATVDGVAGPTFTLTAKADNVTLGDGSVAWAWGYANGNGMMQYPGVTMIVNQGDVVTVKLKNTLPLPVSIVFPGQEGVVATGGSAGLLTKEVPGDGISEVTYTFTATHAGTYLYQSGTRPELEVEMGLMGALIVRPNVTNAAHQAYGHVDTTFDREYLFLITEMDPVIHSLVQAGRIADVDNTAYHPVLWFFNGRNGPDTMSNSNVPWLPTQPYNCLPRMHPGEKVLMRIINAGRDLHPFHHHGNNTNLIARDGRLLESVPGAGPDLQTSDFTIRTVPGETYDAVFTWTGANLGWDIYGHSTADPLQPGEFVADHGKPLPVTLPNVQDLTIVSDYSGSPYLGISAALPPGVGGYNKTGGYYYMWHSHTERELTNDNIYPGGMMTMLIIEHPSQNIP